MSKDLSGALRRLARAHSRHAQGFGSFLEALDALQRIERQLDAALAESLQPFDAVVFDESLPAMMRRQAD